MIEASRFAQAEGLNHRSRGQRPRTKRPEICVALQGHSIFFRPADSTSSHLPILLSSHLPNHRSIDPQDRSIWQHLNWHDIFLDGDGVFEAPLAIKNSSSRVLRKSTISNSASRRLAKPRHGYDGTF
jgi:hypothetical protein